MSYMLNWTLGERQFWLLLGIFYLISSNQSLLLKSVEHLAVPSSYLKSIFSHLIEIPNFSQLVYLNTSSWHVDSTNSFDSLSLSVPCSVSWGCRICRLYLFCRGVRPPHECPVYDTKQSDGEDLVMLELWEMQSTPLLLSFPGLLWPGVVAPDRVLSMGQIKLNSVLMLNWIVWN